MDDDLDMVENVFKGLFLLLTCWLWIPALLMLKVFTWLTK